MDVKKGPSEFPCKPPQSKKEVKAWKKQQKIKQEKINQAFSA